jgi:hypothetical protein
MSVLATAPAHQTHAQHTSQKTMMTVMGIQKAAVIAMM